MMISSSWLFSLLLLLVVTLHHVSGQGFNKVTNESHVPVVFAQVAFNKVSKVDGVEQSFNADFFMQLFWFDMSIQDWLLHNNTGPNVDEFGHGLLPAVASGNFDFTPRLNGWYDPSLEFINGDGDIVESGAYYTIPTPDFITDEQLNDLGFPNATAARDNQTGLIWTVKDYRYIGSFTTPLDLHSFPYDRQYVQLLLESTWADNTTLSIVYTDYSDTAVEKMKPDPVRAPVVGWDVETVQVIRSYNVYNLAGGNYSRLVIEMTMLRQPEYYVYKIVVGVVLLVLMCVCVYSLAVDEADRQMGTLTVFGGIVTFLFVASADVPKIPYLTKLDLFFMFSFLITAAMLVVHSLSYFWREDEGDDDESEAGEQHSKPKQGGYASDDTDNASQAHHTSGRSMGGVEGLHQRKSTQPLSSISPDTNTNVEMANIVSPSPAFGSSSPTNGGDVEEQKQTADNADASSFKVTKRSDVSSAALPVRSKKRGGGRFRRWFRSLQITRKSDSIFVVIFFAAYVIGCLAILVNVKSTVVSKYIEKKLTNWPAE